MARGAAWHPELTTWVDRVDARWVALGLDPPRRRRLRLELVADLAQARRGGAPLAELLAVDADRFATDVAAAEGYDVGAAAQVVEVAAPGPPAVGGGAAVITVPRVATAGLLGSVVGGVASALFVLPVLGAVARHTPMTTHSAEVGIILLAYGAAAVLAALCGAGAVVVSCVDSPDRHRLGRRTFAGLLLSGAAATLVTSTYARATGYSTTSPIVLTEVVLALGTCVLGLVVVARSFRPLTG